MKDIFIILKNQAVIHLPPICCVTGQGVNDKEASVIIFPCSLFIHNINVCQSTFPISMR